MRVKYLKRVTSVCGPKSPNINDNSVVMVVYFILRSRFIFWDIWFGLSPLVLNVPGLITRLGQLVWISSSFRIQDSISRIYKLNHSELRYSQG